MMEEKEEEEVAVVEGEQEGKVEEVIVVVVVVAEVNEKKRVSLEIEEGVQTKDVGQTGEGMCEHYMGQLAIFLMERYLQE